MKKIISIILSIAVIFSLTSCGSNRKSDKNLVVQEIVGYSTMNELPSVLLSKSDYNSFCSYLAYDNIDCPYSELFGVDKALAKKNNRNFDVQEHTYDFFDGSSSVDSNRLSVVFGSLGFYPLLIIGSIVGLITSIIGIKSSKNQYKGRSKIGLGLSIGSLSFWILYFIIFAIILACTN